MTTANDQIDLKAIIKPANAQAVIAALDPAWSIDASGMACIVPYRFNMETLLVAHVDSVPGAGASSLDLVRRFLNFIADVRAKVGATWLPVYACFDATKDRTVADRLVEMGLMATPTARGPGAIRFPPLTAILFGGVGSQVSQAQPLPVSLPGRGRFSVPALHVPKVILYTGVREKLALRQLKIASTPSTPMLLRELENLETKITAARNVTIQPGNPEVHDDLADALALGVFLAREYEIAREDARRRSMRGSRPAPSSAAWT